MSLGKAITSRLTAAQTGDVAGQTSALATIASLVSTRVYPNVSPDNLYPLITYEIEQENEDAIQSQTAKEFNVTLTMAAKGLGAYDIVQQIKTATRTLLDRKSSPNAGWGGVVAKCYLNGSDETADADAGNADALFFEIADTYRAWAAA